MHGGTVIEHSRKHGPFDPRWPRRPQLFDRRPSGASLSKGFDADDLLVEEIATWEAEGGATARARSARAWTTA
jgi:hypothetical protein